VRPTVLALVLLVACASGVVEPTHTLEVRSERGAVLATLRVRVADSDGERRRGLMGVEDLAPDEGMAFVFERPTRNGFWMKNTLIPLSIAWFGPDGRIVAMTEMVPCDADPCPIYTPGAEYVGAVEANAGFFERHGIGVGDVVTLSEPADG
jgi:hypothetical protein